MDSYTDVSTQCCGRGRMNAFPWDSWGSNPALSYPTPAAPVTQPANMSCPSTEGGVLEQQFPVAMAYVPWQQWQTTYAPERGLVQGTIFPDLDLQFNYGRCGR